ncbi:DUF2188 domain-containing protein [Enterobacter kobei]|nr:DUF2188 domain-containing protein [Cronobacter sakazakii]ELY6343806.1 DUF2188 domain-containing protein [Cronobacter muytjensii]EMC7918190.1 DUF2188 domain-containing protein [Enterobacter kobei]
MELVMSGKDYNVYQGADGVWRGKRQDATRASVTGNTQKAVFEQVREFAKKSGAEVSIHRADNNQIREKNSYGNDPRKTKG